MPGERFDVGSCGLVDVDRRLGLTTLEARQPRVNPAPAGADEFHEERQVVDARMPLGEKLSLDPLQPPNRLVEQASDLGDMASDREHLGAEAVANGDADLSRNRCFETRCHLGKRFDLSA